ncbi:glyoxalase [Rhodobacterales bacterium LSUCC0031]|nr:glyoxalase [Rhodobacterales bacterium LSUCC0031]
MTPSLPLPQGARIGHVHLKVSDLAQSIAFYRDALGLELQQLYGDQAAFLSFDGYHHHLGLNTWHSAGGPRPAPDATGLYHTAFLFPDRIALAQALRRALAAGVQIEGAADHGVSEAIYFSDPDGNGIEIYRDRAPQDWPRDRDGQIAMVNMRLDLEELLLLA